VPSLTVPARDAVLLPLGSAVGVPAPSPAVPQTPQPLLGVLPLRDSSTVSAVLRPVPPLQAIAYRADVYQDGYPAVVLENGAIRLIVSPCAGARAFVFEDKRTGRNLFTTTGGLRDAWTPELQPSPRDYIAKYTHPMATGTFNRCYAVGGLTSGASASVTLSYTAPDAPGGSATFRRTIRMPASGAGFEVTESTRFAGAAERALQLSSIATDRAGTACASTNGETFLDRDRRRRLAIEWSGAKAVRLERTPGVALLGLTFRSAAWSVRYRVLAGDRNVQRC